MHVVLSLAALCLVALPEPLAKGPLSPAESVAQLQTPDDLVVRQVLAEPTVTQPVALHFDERGRLWVVEYRQYPNPAGLKMLSRDQYWRSVYDRVPLPPPQGVKGLDRISIHEDSDADGSYDSHKIFVDGLNIATSCLTGRGGVWVLNPPYLLFYPDANRDDVPDADPVVHLEGFGLEDTHSVVNSLTWGPDGWIYAAQGSTVTASVKRPGDKEARRSQGQLIWRYHPETKRYEVFSEGGGNAFGVALDAQARVFSGHNGGDTRGFHYMPGAYLQKGFNKHGPLSNPYAFGYFPPMAHHSVPRFTHTYLFYEGEALPVHYRGKLFGVAPLLSHVVISEREPLGSTFRTKDIGHAITSGDAWFRPVDIKQGPEGAIYVADWYDGQTNHFRNHEGQIDVTNGRIYRLQGREHEKQPLKKLADFGGLATEELITQLRSSNQWAREMALRVLGDRRDVKNLPSLLKMLEGEQGQPALEALWAVHVSGGFDSALATKLLSHADPYVRQWSIRLAGDVPEPLAAMGEAYWDGVAARAIEEASLEVRTEIACVSRRLPGPIGLRLIKPLLAHAEDIDDPRQPLLIWWAIEARCESNLYDVQQLFADVALWKMPLVKQHLLSRLMRRFAAPGRRKDLVECANWLKSPAVASDPEAGAKLVQGFEEAYQGRAITGLPNELVAALALHAGKNERLQLRLGLPEAISKALAIAADSKAALPLRLEVLQVLGELQPPDSLPVLLAVLQEKPADAKNDDLRLAAVRALAAAKSEAVAGAILAVYESLAPETQAAAAAVLASRKDWARQLLLAVEAGKLAAAKVPADVVRRMTIHKDEQMAEIIAKLWGEIDGATTAAMQQQIEQLKTATASGTGSPYAGKKLFVATCAKCHQLHGTGGLVGPDLTTYQRTNVDTMLLSIVNPSAEIREGFETWLAADNDGRIVTGFVADQDNQVVSLRTPEGATVTLARSQLEEFRQQRKSLMPEGLLTGLSDQQVRDLLAYLRSTQPLND